MALQEAAVYRADIVLQFARRRRQQKLTLAGHQSVFSFPQKDARDTWWTETAPMPAFIEQRRHGARAFYMRTRQGVLPTPKLGAKSRRC